MTMENIFVDWQMFKRWRLSHWHLLSLLIINDIKASQIFRMKKKIVPNIKHILYVWLWLISIFLPTPRIIFSNTNKAPKKRESTVQGGYVQMKCRATGCHEILDQTPNSGQMFKLLPCAAPYPLAQSSLSLADISPLCIYVSLLWQALLSQTFCSTMVWWILWHIEILMKA